MQTRLLTTLLLAVLVCRAAAEEKKLWAKSFLGKPAPEFVVEKWLTPEPARKGKWVLIDFWATWCGPCRKAIPELNDFHKKFGDKLVVIGVSDESEDKVRALKEPKIEYASAVDAKARMKKALEVKGIPHVILVDPDGIVRWEGFPLLNGFELTTAEIEKAMKEYAKPIATPKK
jgi:cytochrome c biogenesis protein CcmG, thiol:disulfide interchange protein DsbE